MKDDMVKAHQAIRDLMSSAGPELQRQRDAYDRWGEAFPLPEGTVIAPLEFARGTLVTTPRSEPDRYVLYLHGGSYRMGSSRSHRELAANVADATRAAVALLDYPLAPEHPFPAALDAARDAYTALLDRVPAHRMALVGESAGGGLAIATMLRLKDEGLPLPGAAAVNSPWVDMEATGRSMIEREARDPLVSRQQLLGSAADYLAGADPGHPYVSPVHGDLTGLPPLLIQVGTEETLYDDALTLHGLAVEADVEATLIVVPGAPHVWHHLASWLPEGREAVEAVGRHVVKNTAHAPRS
ncbi:alpha/beta hydrolase [Streptomyces sp. NPDC026672]|uniref:alpha/beta hydrolase n=1 Tax=unclassified Streptomyces TaxID=2593676 RepID=UPI0033E0C632